MQAHGGPFAATRRKEAGRLYEIPILVALAAISLGVGVGQRSWVVGLAVFLGVPAVFFLLISTIAAFGAVYARLRMRRLRARLQSKDADQRLDTAHRLKELGSEAAGAAPGLLAALEDPDTRVRLAAAMALVSSGVSPESATPVLAQALGDAATRDAAAEALGRVGHAASGALGALRMTLEDRGWSERWRAFHVIGHIGAEAREAVPDLIRALRDTDASVAEWAAAALGDIGPESASAIPILEDLAHDRGRSRVRGEAIEALGKIGTAGSCRVLVALLRDQEPWVRSKALYALGDAGKDAIDSLPAIQELASDGSESVRRAAVAAVAQIQKGSS